MEGAAPRGEGDRAVEALRARVDQMSWYHTQEPVPGVVTPGMFDLRDVVERYELPADLTGQRVLEVGTFEGFWAFELERRGADVTALDIDRIQELDWPPRMRPEDDGQRGEGFELVRAARGSSVRRVGSSIYEATPDSLGGTFDVVFCGSVLIHLRDPMLALERMAALCHGRLILAEEYSRRFALLPFRNLVEFRGESPSMVWWRPSPRAWLSMVAVAGFEDPQIRGRFSIPFREGGKGVSHVLINARGEAARRPASS
jgi:tRNA (mo5U34)-methyltransferase